MPKRSTWKVLKWDDEPAEKTWVPLECKCGHLAEVESGVLKGGMIIAGFGMGFIYDPPGFQPPKNFMPTEIQCRRCGRIYADWGRSDAEKKAVAA